MNWNHKTINHLQIGWWLRSGWKKNCMSLQQTPNKTWHLYSSYYMAKQKVTFLLLRLDLGGIRHLGVNLKMIVSLKCVFFSFNRFMFRWVKTMIVKLECDKIETVPLIPLHCQIIHQTGGRKNSFVHKCPPSLLR